MNLSSYPHLVKEWHPTKNGELTPKNFTFGSNKKIWWQCSKKHNFESIIRSRTIQKSGCPYCSGRKASQNNNLLVSFPETAKEWHPIKNGKLRPSDFTRGSDKKIWWLCPKNHSYEARISQRTRKKQPNNCPYCSGQKVGKDNNLLFLFPDIAKEWHPTKNGKLRPNEFTRGSEKKVWWLCSKGHSYSSAIGGRTGRNRGCPYCSGREASDDNNLLILFPKVAKEWHPTKNKGLTPSKVTSKSSKKAWWLCPKGHNYKTVINYRTGKNTGCPYCAGQKSLNLDLFK